MTAIPIIRLTFVLALGVPGAWWAPAAAQSIPVEIVRAETGAWQLLRGGEPYFIRGAGGDAPKDLLAAAGGNTFRTWGVGPELREQLDEAHALGLTVVVGHWLGHPRHGFDYDDPGMVAEQLERVRRDVIEYRDHPALLMWGIGNEMEGFEEGDDPAVWSHVQDLAAMIKRLDPNHPTMTVTAEIGGARVRAVHEMAPDIDVMGINSYGGLASLPGRYREAGGTKPIVITEFGPPGTWEIGRTSFGAPPEWTSTEKAEFYRSGFTAGCLDAEGLCLGGFAFAWGWKVETTSTWFGMFLPNGDRLAAVDAMTELWSGEPPENRAPEVRSFRLRGPDVVEPGDTVRVDLDVVDQEGAAVTVNWVVTGEVSEYETFGDSPPAPFELDGIIVESSAEGATLVMPGGGVYRLYMTASDGEGGGATANVPLMVDGPPGGVRIALPLAVLAAGEAEPWAPSGWMGNFEALTLDTDCENPAGRAEGCLRFEYRARRDWVGVAWQHPVDDWGDQPGGFDLTGATRLTFWARGERGGERVDFGVGLLGRDKPYYDTANAELNGVELTGEWRRYEIDLDGEDLSRIKTPFYWVLRGNGPAITFFVADIRFE